MTDTVAAGDHVLLCSDRYTHIKPFVISTEKIKFGKAVFKLNTLIGVNYGSMFFVDRDRLIPVTDPKHFELDREEIASGSDNRQIQDGSGAQKLSQDQIDEMKRSGVTGTEILGKIVESSSSFQLKTEFAQEKYIAKKEKKYMQHLVVERPSSRLLAEMYFKTNPGKICYMRPDSLALLLSRANVCTNTKVMVAETTSGLITGAVLERIAGMGHVLQVHAGEHPTRAAIDMFNFSERDRAVLSTFSMELLGDDENAPVSEASDAALRQRSEEKYQQRLEKRARNAQLKLTLSRADFDSLIIAVKSEPHELIRSLWPSLGMSRPFVVFSPYIEPLAECFGIVKSLGAINVSLAETWMREYQVLDRRTHPTMMTSAASGYLLSGIKVDPGECAPWRPEPKGHSEGRQNQLPVQNEEEREDVIAKRLCVDQDEQ